jgi:hypothetical protein
MRLLQGHQVFETNRAAVAALRRSDYVPPASDRR